MPSLGSRGDVGLPPRLPHGGSLRRRRRGPGRRDAGAREPDPALTPTASEVHQLRERRRPRGHGLQPEPHPLLPVRAPLRDVRRGGRVHLPVGHPPRGPVGVRAGRDGGLHLHPGPRPRLRLAQGSAAVGLVEKGKVPKSLTWLLNYGRKRSLWVYQWGLACCAIEMGAAFGSPRYDVMRLGVIPLPASPRQADLVVISGTVTDKIVPAIKRLYEQMPDPKYVISMGSCANCGGPYWDSYSVTKGVDPGIPVDVSAPRAPPRPEGLAHVIFMMQELT